MGIKISVLRGTNGLCLSVNQTRVTNRKIYGILEPVVEFDVEPKDLFDALGVDFVNRPEGECYIDNEGYEKCSVCHEHETGMRYFDWCPRCGSKLKKFKPKGDIICL